MKHKNLPKYNEGAHFVTTKTYENKPYFLDKICCDILIEELDFYRTKYGFRILGYVIMPDHLHLIIWWDIETNKDLRISKIINSFKTMTSKRIKRYLFFDGGIQYVENLPHTISRLPDVGSLTDLGGLTDVGQSTRTLSPYSTSSSESASGGSNLPHNYKWTTTGNIHTMPSTKIWQLGYYDFNIISEEKLWEKMDYIHENPYKDKKIKNPEEYAYSSKLFFEKEKDSLSIDIIN